jgi:hypothetical protein
MERGSGWKKKRRAREVNLIIDIQNPVATCGGNVS